MGLPGDKGPKGNKGPKGERGPMGPKGSNGDRVSSRHHVHVLVQQGLPPSMLHELGSTTIDMYMYTCFWNKLMNL